MIDDDVSRNAIAEAFRTAVDRVVAQQVRRGIAQEHQITSKVSQAVEDDLNGKTFGDYRLRVAAQDLSDKGTKALEPLVGGDLYVGISVDHPIRRSKGFLVQAKIVPEGKLKIVRSAGLVRQCRDLQEISQDGSYVWVYGREGASVATAAGVINQPRYSRKSIATRSVYDQVVGVLECSEGDSDRLKLPVTLGAFKSFEEPRSGRTRVVDVFDDDYALGRMLRELGVKNGLAVQAKKLRRD